MNKDAIARPTWALVGFALSLLFPSIGIVQKYLGTAAVAGYVGLAFLAVLVAYAPAVTRLVCRVSERAVLPLTLATFLCLGVMFAVIYPIANSGVAGRGSDRDEALTIATRELVHGRYPYYQHTYLGNPITPLPGSLLLAIPFVALGNSAYQNFFWLLMFFVALKSYLKDGRLALRLLLTVLALSPIVLHELVTGGDLVANSLYVLILMMLMVAAPGGRAWRQPVSAVAFGVGLSSRANYVLLLPLAFSMLTRSSGLRTAIKCIALTCATLALVTVPFYLYDPAGFSPLHTVEKIGRFRATLPFAGVIVPAAAGLVSIALSVRHLRRDRSVLLRDCAIVQALPVAAIVILASVQSGKPNLISASFGLSFLFFAALAYALSEADDSPGTGRNAGCDRGQPRLAPAAVSDDQEALELTPAAEAGGPALARE